MSYHIELRHLYYFKTLAEELHFRRAAERLFIAQPGLSRQIKQLELHYGTPLFLRTKRRVELTSAGRFLYQEVTKLFAHLDQVANKMEKIATGKFMALKVGFIGSAIQAILPQLLIKLNQKHPAIDLSLNELSTNLQLNMLEKFELDIGFLRTEVPAIGLQAKTVLRETFSLVVPKGRLAEASNYPTPLEAFKESPFILFSRDYSNSYYELVMSIFRDHGFQPTVALKTVNALTIFTLVSQGLGVAIVPSSLQKGYHTQVDFIELVQLPQRTTLSVLWNPKNSNPAVPLFLKVLTTQLTSD